MRKTVLTCLSGLVCLLFCARFASAQHLPVPIPQLLDPLLQNLSIPADAATAGMWSSLNDWPLVSVHSAVTPDGRVVTFGSPFYDSSHPDTAAIDRYIFDIWNPRIGFTGRGGPSHRVLAGAPAVNSFCSASVLLSTGELLTSGGRRTDLDGNGVPLNRFTSKLNAVRNTVSSNGIAMTSPRYYSTQTMLPDGRVLITGGSWPGDATFAAWDPVNTLNKVSGTPEVCCDVNGNWSSLFGAASAVSSGNDAFGPQDNRWWYPRQWVAPNGKVFGISTHQTWYLDPIGSGSITLGAKLKADPTTGNSTVGQPGQTPNVGATSTAVMFDVGRILQVGGNGRVNSDGTHDWTTSSNFATIIDINPTATNPTGAPQFSEATAMTYGRQWANATVLPDGRVLVTGGTRVGNSVNTNDAVHQAEIWNPSSNTWTLGASASETRVYHQTALLLPDGTVLTSGSGGPPGWPVTNPAKFSAEVYYPPYLFQASGGGSILAARPRILSMNARQFGQGGTIQAEISSGNTVTKAVLVGLGTTTHGFDMGQRLYPASFTQSGTIVSLTVPNANVTPPGYYFLFVSNQNGVPSEGVIVAIGSSVAAPQKPRQILDFDGDRKSDLAVFRPPYWHLITSSAGFPYTGNVHLLTGAAAGDIPTPGDYDGDGVTDISYYHPADGTWTIVTSSSGFNYATALHVNIGAVSTDIPVPGDYDGDGKTDIAVFRPGDGYLHIATAAAGFPYGANLHYSTGAVSTDIPVPGDYDGDGITDFAIYRPGDGYLHIMTAAAGFPYAGNMHINTGAVSTDIPVPGDYDGDGITDFAIYRPGDGYFHIFHAAAGFLYGADQHINTGAFSTDIPLAGDFDGDGLTDFAVYRPSDGYFHIFHAAAGFPYGADQHINTGAFSTDIPVSLKY